MNFANPGTLNYIVINSLIKWGKLEEEKEETEVVKTKGNISINCIFGNTLGKRRTLRDTNLS